MNIKKMTQDMAQLREEVAVLNMSAQFRAEHNESHQVVLQDYVAFAKGFIEDYGQELFLQVLREELGK